LTGFYVVKDVRSRLFSHAILCRYIVTFIEYSNAATTSAAVATCQVNSSEK